jgi:hypothetical protein
MTEQTNNDDFDLIEDLLFFINNDPDFYRAEYFPVATSFVGTIKSDNTAKPSHFKNVIEKAYQSYKDKFQLDSLPKVLTPDQVEELCAKLHSQEVNHFHNQDVNEDIARLKKLAGISSSVVHTIPSINKPKIMRENNIVPGSDEWFKLWFSTSGANQLSMTPPFRGRKR